MRDVLGPGTILGYCMNVHGIMNLADFFLALSRDALAVKERVAPESCMGVGLWLPMNAVASVLEMRAANVHRVSDALLEQGLLPYTMNGFPMHDFHAPSVKHAVYQPSWLERQRVAYTLGLAAILADVMDRASGMNHDRSGGISTLPLGWPDQFTSDDNFALAADNLLWLTDELRRIEDSTGILIHIDLEPEPGCVLQRSEDVVQFFKDQLLARCAKRNLSQDHVFRHIRVCHDICHAVVMLEDQAEMFARYHVAGIQIGKVQISNAIRADLRNLSAAKRTEVLSQLRQFSEDRYLHQTMISTNGSLRFFDDLPKAIDEFDVTDRAAGGYDEWRVHFHVPVYLEEFGLLQTTRDHIIECMKLLKGSEVKHWEVETYAWNVLPDELKVPDLADGIARELLWVKEQAARIK